MYVVSETVLQHAYCNNVVVSIMYIFISTATQSANYNMKMNYWHLVFFSDACIISICKLNSLFSLWPKSEWTICWSDQRERASGGGHRSPATSVIRIRAICSGQCSTYGSFPESTTIRWHGRKVLSLSGDDSTQCCSDISNQAAAATVLLILGYSDWRLLTVNSLVHACLVLSITLLNTFEKTV